MSVEEPSVLNIIVILQNAPGRRPAMKFGETN
jgi:hypothetical protein